jgi:F-type H+-transporting ATPase subunit alpha
LNDARDWLSGIDFSRNEYSEGVVTLYSGGAVAATGLSGDAFSEIVRIYNYEYSKQYSLGLAFNPEKEQVGVICLDENQEIHVGSKIITTAEIFPIEVSGAMLGRAVDDLRRPVDGLVGIYHKDSRRILFDRKAHSVIERQSVSVPLQTGIAAIDALAHTDRSAETRTDNRVAQQVPEFADDFLCGFAQLNRY